MKHGLFLFFFFSNKKCPLFPVWEFHIRTVTKLIILFRPFKFPYFSKRKGFCICITVLQASTIDTASKNVWNQKQI